MTIKRIQEKDLLEDLDADKVHADDLANVTPEELEPLERLKGSVKRYDRPFDSVWDDDFDSSEQVTDDFLKDRDQSKGE
jgi:antitoxin VapB